MVIYAGVGFGVVIVRLFTSTHAPDIVNAFAWGGALGWFTGAFSSAFAKSA